MHVLIMAAGSAGDVYPFIAVGQVLLARGHEVQIAAADAYRPQVERAGLGFITLLDQRQMDEIVADRELWHATASFPAVWKRLGRSLPATYDLLLRHVRPGATLMVASTLGLAARLVQETHGIALVTVHLAPSCFFSATDPAVRGGLPWLEAMPPWLVRKVLDLVEDRILDPLICADLDPLRSRLGLPPVRKVMSRWMHSPQRVVCAFPEWFAPPQPDWPPNTLCTAFPRLAHGSQDGFSDELHRFLDAGGDGVYAPVACTAGSAMAHGRAFFQRAIEAIGRLGLRGVLVTPYRDQLPGVLPPFIHHASYVPYDLLAPKVSAFIHHGGIGTSAQVLAAGKPQLIVPFAFDQPDNARRLRRLGVAASVAPGASAAAWARALGGLLNRPSVQDACRAAAAMMARETSAAAWIAELIELQDPHPARADYPKVVPIKEYHHAC